MSLDRPTLTEIETRIRADLKAHLPDADPELRRGNLQVISRVLAGSVHGLYGLAQRLSEQIMADTAELAWLERHSGIWGIARKSATNAEGNLAVTGDNGAVVALGAEFKRSDDARFFATAETTLTGGSASVPVIAADAGENGNTESDVAFTLLSYLEGVNTSARSASGGITGGADAESDAALRARVITRIQEPPQGGAASDYEAWALEVEGVTRAYVYPGRTGDGTVGVTILLDDSESGPLPSETEVAAVQAYIDERRPVTADVTVFACVAAPVDFEIALTPDTEAVRAAVQASLAELFLRESEPEGELLISHIREAISLAAGETDHTLVSPTADQAAGAGELLTIGTITWS